MIPVLLTKIRTRDGVTLEGIYVRPKQKSSTALIWIHGLSSRFSSGQTLIKELSARCQRSGIGYFKFNTRGHDVVAHGGERLLGSAFEKFEDCVIDIGTMIRAAKKLGYKKIILAGHSSGANKVLYYLYQTKDHSINGLILIAGLSDITVGLTLFGSKKLKRGLARAKKLTARRKHIFMPPEFLKSMVLTAPRFLSLFRSGSREDVFPYHHPRASWKELKSVRIPLAVIIGSRDEYLDRPTKKLIRIFCENAVNAKSFSGIIIKGAHHGFRRKEKELSRVIMQWMNRAIV